MSQPIEGIFYSLKTTEEFFLRSTSIFAEADSGFLPAEGTYTVASQIAHVAFTVDWFMEGAFGSGWTMDFETDIRKARAVTSVATALSEFRRAMEQARQRLASLPPDVVCGSFPADDPFFPGAPRLAIVEGIVDHTAHHRGALTVYARLLGKVAPMPYM